MSENNDNLPVPTQTTGSSPPARRQWPLWLAVLIVLSVSAYSLWLGLERQQDQERLDEALAQMDERQTRLLDRMDSALEDLSSQRADQLDRLERRLEAHQDRLEEQARQIEANAQSLLGMGVRTRTDWLLAEAEYLLRLANQRLLFERDVAGALAILRSADEALRDADDVGSFAVRQQLAREILSLEALDPIDRTGLYLRLEAAAGLIAELGPDRRELTHPDQEPVAVPEEATTGQRLWAEFRHTLRDIVIIRRMDEPVAPMLSPDAVNYARLQLHLMLEEAQLALVREDVTVYRRTLRKAVAWVDQWFDGDAPQARALTAQLRELKDYDIAPRLPDISQSLTLLKNRIAGRVMPRTGEESSGSATDEDGDS